METTLSASQSGDSTNPTVNEIINTGESVLEDGEIDEEELMTKKGKRKLSRVLPSSDEENNSGASSGEEEEEEEASKNKNEMALDSSSEDDNSSDDDDDDAFPAQGQSSSFYNKHDNKRHDEDDDDHTAATMKKFNVNGTKPKGKKNKRCKLIEDECEHSSGDESKGENDDEEESPNSSDEEFVNDEIVYEPKKKKSRKDGSKKRDPSKMEKLRSRHKSAKNTSKREIGENSVEYKDIIRQPIRKEVTEQCKKHLSVSVDAKKVEEFSASKVTKAKTLSSIAPPLPSSSSKQRPSKFGFAITPSPISTPVISQPKNQLHKPPATTVPAPPSIASCSSKPVAKSVKHSKPQPSARGDIIDSGLKSPGPKSNQTTLPTKYSGKTYQVGDVFKQDKTSYTVSHRGNECVYEGAEESSDKIAFDKCTVSMYSTCEIDDDGKLSYVLFLLKKFYRPHLLSSQEASKIDARHFKSDSEKKKRYLNAKECDNIDLKHTKTSTTATIGKLIMHPELYSKKKGRESQSKKLSGPIKSYGKEGSAVMALFVKDFLSRTPMNIHTVLTRNAQKWKECDAVPLSQRGAATIKEFGSDLLEQVICFIILADAGGKYKKQLPPNPLHDDDTKVIAEIVDEAESASIEVLEDLNV